MIIPENLRNELAEDNKVSIEDDIPATTTLKWVCTKNSQHVWETALYNKLNSSGCPICLNRKLVVGVNDLATTHPDLLEKWSSKNTLTPQEVTSSYSKKLWWTCDHGHNYETKITYLLKGCKCPYCNGNKAYKGFNDAATLYPALVPEVSENSSIHLDEVTKGSSAKILWQCQNGHEWESPVSARIRGRGCPICANKKIIVGINDLNTTHPELVKEWHSLNSKTPTEVTRGSDYKAYWVCPENPHHIYEMTVYRRTQENRPQGCSYCSGKKILEGEQDLLHLNPELAEEYSPKNEIPSSKISLGSSRKVIWVDKYGHEWITSIKARIKGNSGCPICANKVFLYGFNDLETNYPLLAKEFDCEKNGLKPQDILAGGTIPYWWKCNQGHSWKAIIGNRIYLNAGCPKCVHHVSKAEIEITDFIRSILPNDEIKTSDRKVIGPKELDIYIPSKQVAIEFHGLYWHTEKTGKTRNYHKDKHSACEAQGIQLLQIWEDEWANKQTIVKNMIASKLGVSTQPKVFARKTQIIQVSKNDARDFLNTHHIQGYAAGSHYIGLQTKDTQELVAVMVLRKLKNEMYLDRYATSKQVVGGQGKLLHWVDENLEFDQLVTFADLQISNGHLYEVTGWRKDKVLNPDYRYLVNGERVHKFNYRLKRFKNDPDLVWEEGLSETELAILNNLDRVWDSGKIRYVRDHITN